MPIATAPGRVMTPRAASEQLVEAAIAHVGGRPARLADVGTGSGAIAVAVATALRRAQVWATDIDPAAVALARANVRRHGLEGRVFVLEGDLLAPVPGRFDLIVANLPYLAAATAAAHPELGAEPKSAVFVAGDGLDPYRRLAVAARERLAPGGLLAVQLHRRLLVAEAEELDGFTARLEAVAA